MGKTNCICKEIGEVEMAPTYRTVERQSANIYMTTDSDAGSVFRLPNYTVSQAGTQQHGIQFISQLRLPAVPIKIMF